MTECNDDVYDSEPRPTYTDLIPVSHEYTQLHVSTPWQNGQINFHDYSELDESHVLNDSRLPHNHIPCDSVYLDSQSTTTDTTRSMEAYMEQIESIKDRPKTILIDEIRQLTRDCVADIEMLRDALFEKACARDDFPSKEGYLRKRKETRAPNAPSIQAKLARDCFVLIRACEGEFTDDLPEVVPTKPKRTQSLSDNTGRNRGASDIAGVNVLTGTVAVLKRYVHLLKSDYNERIEKLSSKLDTILKEKDNAKNRALKYKEDIKQLQIKVTEYETACEQKQQSYDALETTLNELNLKQSENLTEIHSLKTEIDTIRKEVCPSMKSIENETCKNKKQLDKTTKQLAKVKTDINEILESTTDVKNIAKRYDNEQLNGVVSVKKALKLESERVTSYIKCYETDLDKTRESIKTCATSLVGLKKQLDKFRKDTLKKPEHKVTSGRDNIAREGRSKIEVDTTNRFDVLRVDTQGNLKSKSPAHTPNDVMDKSITSDSPRRRSWSDVVHSMSPIDESITTLGNRSKTPAQTPDQHPITVHCPGAVCNPIAKRFVGFQQQPRRRIKRFYVHGINRQIASEASMRSYLEDANVRVTWIRYFEKRWKNTASAQLNIVAEDAGIICKDSFWPEGIRMREWQPREVFLSEHRHG